MTEVISARFQFLIANDSLGQITIFFDNRKALKKQNISFCVSLLNLMMIVMNMSV